MKKFFKTLAKEVLVFTVLWLIGTGIAIWLGMPVKEAAEKTCLGTLFGFLMYCYSKRPT